MIVWEKVLVKVLFGVGMIECIMVQKGYLFVFVFDKDFDVNCLYLQECDEECNMLGELRIIFEIVNLKGRKSGGEFIVFVFDNLYYVVVLSIVIDVKSGDCEVGYKILDVENDFFEVKSGCY